MTRPLRFNIARDSVEIIGEYVADAVNRMKGCQSLYVAADGGVRLIPDAGKQPHRPDAERIGRYRKGVPVEVIEDDLLQWQREQAGRVAA
jgi:hypothetical protein